MKIEPLSGENVPGQFGNASEWRNRFSAASISLLPLLLVCHLPSAKDHRAHLLAHALQRTVEDKKRVSLSETKFDFAPASLPVAFKLNVSQNPVDM